MFSFLGWWYDVSQVFMIIVIDCTRQQAVDNENIAELTICPKTMRLQCDASYVGGLLINSI